MGESLRLTVYCGERGTSTSDKMVDADTVKKICDIYDWDGKGELDLFYLGDIMYAMGYNTTKKVCVGLGQTDKEGKKFAKFDDVVSKVEEALKTPDSQGTYADYVELLKLYDKNQNGTWGWLSWTTSCATSETRSPRRMCRRCSLRSATPRMRTVCSPTCPSSTGSPARPKNPTKLQYLQLHPQTLLHKQHQTKRGAWRIYIKPKHFAFLENRDNTNVDSNPTKTSMNLKNSAQGKFSNWPNASPLAAWRLRTLGPQQTERGTGGTNARGLQVHQEGERLEDGQLSLKHQHRRSRRSLASAFLLGSLPCPPAPRRLAVPASFAFSRLTCWILV